MAPGKVQRKANKKQAVVPGEEKDEQRELDPATPEKETSLHPEENETTQKSQEGQTGDTQELPSGDSRDRQEGLEPTTPVNAISFPLKGSNAVPKSQEGQAKETHAVPGSDRKENKAELEPTTLGKAPSLPPACKACFLRSGLRKVQGCDHVFCDQCLVKLSSRSHPDRSAKDATSPKENYSAEQVPTFWCPICKKQVEQGETQDKTNIDSEHEISEIIAKGCKRIAKQSIPADATTPSVLDPAGFEMIGQDFLLVDRNRKQVILLSTEGTLITSFNYLQDHEFQGGLAVSQKEQVLLGLTSTKYSCVSYYTRQGVFQFSAFLESGAKPCSLTVTSGGNVVVLDSLRPSLIFINEEKTVYKTISLAADIESRLTSESCELKPGYNCHCISTSLNDDLIHYDAKSKEIKVYNSEGDFKQCFSVAPHNTLPQDAQSNTSSGVAMCIDKYGSIFVLEGNIQAHWSINRYSWEGHFMDTLVQYGRETDDLNDKNFKLVGLSFDQQGALLVCYQLKGKVEIRKYSYTTSRKHIPASTKASTCVIL